MKKYRVLIIDDTDQVLEIVSRELNKEKSLIEDNLEVVFDIETLSITFNEEKEISDQCLQALAKAAKIKYDYIFSDFAFISDKDINQKKKEELLQLDEGDMPSLDKEFTKGWLCTLLELKERFQSRKSELFISGFDTKNIINNFFKHSGNVLVYTNSPEPFNYYFNGKELDARIETISYVFEKIPPKEIKIVKIHDKYSITQKIMDGLANQENNKFKSSLVTNYIQSLIKENAFRFMIRSQRRMRIWSLSKSIAILGTIGLFLGIAISTFTSIIVSKYEVFINSAERGWPQYLQFCGFALTLFLIIVLLSVVYALWSEKRLNSHANNEVDND